MEISIWTFLLLILAPAFAAFFITRLWYAHSLREERLSHAMTVKKFGLELIRAQAEAAQVAIRAARVMEQVPDLDSAPPESLMAVTLRRLLQTLPGTDHVVCWRVESDAEAAKTLGLPPASIGIFSGKYAAEGAEALGALKDQMGAWDPRLDRMEDDDDRGY